MTSRVQPDCHHRRRSGRPHRRVRSSTSAGVPATVLEADTVVGGISRTVERDGWRFDIGGHRFFTKVPAGSRTSGTRSSARRRLPHAAPHEPHLLPTASSSTTRCGRSNALRNLGLVEALRCVLSYLWARVRPPKDQTTFEGWVAARFGWRLYRIFFKTYTEKVWGVPGHRDPGRLGRAAHQEPLARARRVVNARPAPKRNQKDITSLIEEFQYPKYGPGMMWERCREHGRGRRAPRSCSMRRSSPIEHDGRPGHRGDRRDRRRRRPRYPCDPRDLVDAASARCCAPWTRRRPTTCCAAADGAALPRLPHRRPRRARERRRSPTTGSTSTTPRCSSAASRTSARGRPTWSRRAAPASASSTS